MDFLAAGLEAEQKQKADELAAARRLAEEAEARRRAEAERAREAELREQEAHQYAEQQRRLKCLADEEAKKARREADRAQSLLLAARSNEVHDEKPLLALLLAVEAVRPLLKEGVNTPRLTTSEQTLAQTIDILPRHRIFVAGYSAVNRVAFAPDGKALASASDKTVRLWDLTAPDPAASPRVLTHDDSVWHVAFAPDGKTLASASGRHGPALGPDRGRPRRQPTRPHARRLGLARRLRARRQDARLRLRTTRSGSGT